MVDSLKTKTVSQTVFKCCTETCISHHITSFTIYITCAGTRTNTLQCCVLSGNAGLMRSAPLFTDSPGEECARQFGPVAIDANLQLHCHGIALGNGII